MAFGYLKARLNHARQGLGQGLGHGQTGPDMVLTGPDWSWCTRPGMTLGTPWYTTLGTPHHGQLVRVRVHGHGYGYESVLWALKGRCVTLKPHLKSI